MKTKPNGRGQANRPGRPAPGRTLTPQAVAEAALRLIDTEGEAEFSMRRLGQALGVEAMALYNHFDDKEAILDAVAALAFSRIAPPSPRGPWTARIKQLDLSVRRLALEHPNLFPLVVTRKTPPASSFALMEAALSAFADAGLSPEMQLVAYHTNLNFVRGFCLGEISEFKLAEHRDTAAESPELHRHPRARAALAQILCPDRDRLFEDGIDVILRGLCTPQLG